MKEQTIAVIGAAGLVGQGTVAMALAAGHRVIAIARTEDALAALGEAHRGNDRLTLMSGSLADDASAHALAERLAQAKVESIVVSVNVGSKPQPVGDLEGAELLGAMQNNLVPHLTAARHLLPIVPEGGMFLGIGGGMADLVMRGMVAASINQSAQRTLYRYLAKEYAKSPIHIRELMIFSMLTPGDQFIESEPYRISAEEVGRHVCAILADPDGFSGPILALRSKEQVSLPEASE